MTDGHGTDPLLRAQSLETLRTRKELSIGATGQETSRKGVCKQAGAVQGGEGTQPNKNRERVLGGQGVSRKERGT